MVVTAAAAVVVDSSRATTTTTTISSSSLLMSSMNMGFAQRQQQQPLSSFSDHSQRREHHHLRRHRGLEQEKVDQASWLNDEMLPTNTTTTTGSTSSNNSHNNNNTSSIDNNNKSNMTSTSTTMMGGGGGVNNTNTTTNTSSSNGVPESNVDSVIPTQQDQQEIQIVWIVYSFALLLLVILMGLCWRFHSSRYLRGQQVNDLNAAARRQADAAKKKKKVVTPEQRHTQLTASFQRQKVTMVVQEGDICQEIIIMDSMSSSFRIPPTGANNNKNSNDNEAAATSMKPTTHGNDGDAAGASHSLSLEDSTRGALLCNTGDNDDGCNDGAVVVEEQQDNNDVDNISAGFVKEDVDDEDEDDPDDIVVVPDECESGYLTLRTTPTRGKQPPRILRQVPNCCAICLSPYDIGESVVWSSNVHCKHAFHMDCMMDWLIKMYEVGTPCPCCRQDFTDLIKHRHEKKITWAPGNTFNTNVIAWR